MDFYTLSDKGIEDEIGRRIKALRLRKNITQKELAEATTVSLNTIKSLESGSGKLSTVIAVLRELGALEQISPLQLARMQGRQRVRASGGRRKHRAEDDAEW